MSGFPIIVLLAVVSFSVSGEASMSEKCEHYNGEYTLQAQEKLKQVVALMDAIEAYLRELGTEKGSVKEDLQNQIFTEDFQGTMNGKVIVPDRSKLAAHFQHIKDQVKIIDLIIHRRIFTPHVCVMNYEIQAEKRDGQKKRNHVMAIFDIQNDKISKITAVVNPEGSAENIDFISQ